MPRVTSGHGETELDAEALAFLEQQWAQQVTPHTGHESYSAMARELASGRPTGEKDIIPFHHQVDPWAVLRTVRRRVYAAPIP